MVLLLQRPGPSGPKASLWWGCRKMGLWPPCPGPPGPADLHPWRWAPSFLVLKGGQGTGSWESGTRNLACPSSSWRIFKFHTLPGATTGDPTHDKGHVERT